MATRGTAMLITEDMVLFGPEFNGDMDPRALGKSFFRDLAKVENNVEFIKFNNSFNKKNHEYSNIMSRYQGKFEHEEISENGKISMKNIYEDSIVTSDWIFIKNTSNKVVTFAVLDEDKDEIDVELKPNELTALYFGIYEYGTLNANEFGA